MPSPATGREVNTGVPSDRASSLSPEHGRIAPLRFEGEDVAEDVTITFEIDAANCGEGTETAEVDIDIELAVEDDGNPLPPLVDAATTEASEGQATALLTGMYKYISRNTNIIIRIQYLYVYSKRI